MEEAKRMRILSVEDEESTATVVRMLLERELEASVDTAPDCASAREFLASNSYDIITLDHQLPDGDGLSLLKEIVEGEGAPPVIMVTAHGDESTAVSAFKLGASGYVVKDARMSTLLIEEARSALARAGIKKSEEALRESEERYRTLFECSRDALMTLSPPSWRFTSCNPKALEMFQAKDENEFTSVGPWGLSPDLQPDGRASAGKAREMIDTALRDGSCLFEWTHKRLGGEDFSATVMLTRMEISGQTVVQATVRDITERKRAEEELENSRDELKAIYDSIGDGVMVLDLEAGTILRANPALVSMLGFSEEELVGMPITKVHPPEELERVGREMEKGRKGLNRVQDLVCMQKDGSTFPVDMTGMTINYQGRPCGVAIFKDIPERKAAEDALLRANKELEGYAHTVSHDLRGPLTAMGLASDVLSSQLAMPLTEDNLEDMKNAASVMSMAVKKSDELISDLLGLAEAGQAPRGVREIDVRRVVLDVLEEKSGVIADKRVEVRVDDRLGTVTMNETHAYQVFSNLIGNAIKHNDSPEPVIEVSSLPPGASGAPRYLVRDNGSGILTENLDRIFMPFFKGRETGETGIGLSTVEKIVKVYGGRIRAYNDNGACFEFTLPPGARHLT